MIRVLIHWLMAISVVGFLSSTAASQGVESNYVKYERYAESLINNYDKDKDGKLNKEETKQMRRPPVGADVNNDGWITREEILAHLLLAKYDKDKDGKLSQAEFVDSLTVPLSSSSKKDDDKSPKSSPRSPESSSQAKYERYADALLKQYDEDKDGQLSQEEQKKMRRPPAGADSNNDGMASRNELIDFFSGKSTNPPSKKSKPGPAKDQTEDGERISRTQYTEAGAKHILFSLGSWQWVQAETSKTLALSPVEMCQLRAAVTQFPTGNRYFVLAVAEYRMRNFQKAIDAATKVADAPNDGEARPRAELAILALSHLRLNNVEQANNYREQLNSLDERIRDEFPTSIFLENTNEESFLSWHREVNQLFDSRQDSDGGG